MQVKLNETFYKNYSYTHKYDEYHDVLWEVLEVLPQTYKVQYKSLTLELKHTEVTPSDDIYKSFLQTYHAQLTTQS